MRVFLKKLKKNLPLPELKPESSIPGIILRDIRHWMYSAMYSANLVKLSDNQIASSVSIDTIKIWDAFLNKCVSTITTGNDIISSLAALRDCYLAVGLRNGGIQIWKIRETKPTLTKTLRGHSAIICSLVLLSDGKLVSSSGDKTIKLWNITTGVCEKTLIDEHADMIFALAVLPNGQLASSAVDTIKLWDLSTSLCTEELKGDGDTQAIYSLTASPNGQLLSGHNKIIKIWNLKTYQCETILTGHTQDIQSLVVLNDETTLASSSRDCTIKLWDLPSGQLIQTLTGHDGPVNQLAIMADEQLISCSDFPDGTLKRWRHSMTSTEELTINLDFLKMPRIQEIKISPLSNGICMTNDKPYYIALSPCISAIKILFRDFERMHCNEIDANNVEFRGLTSVERDELQFFLNRLFLKMDQLKPRTFLFRKKTDYRK